MTFRERNRWGIAFLLLTIAAMDTLPLSVARAQEAAAEEGASEADSDEKFLKGSEETILQTVDGVYLSVRLWLPEKGAGKETPIVILMHMRGKSQSDWFPYAKYLQENGMAVCTFDFRGHGQSRDINPDVYVPVADAIKKAERLSPRDLERPVIPRGQREVVKREEEAAEDANRVSDRLDQAEEFRTGKELVFALPIDLQTVKDFLVLKHNSGQINIRRLGIVGAEMSCTILLDWMRNAEFKPSRARGWEQIDSDTAAVVLISPTMNLLGQKPATEFSQQGEEVPIMIVSGNDRKSADEATKLARKLRVPERVIAAAEEGSDKGPKVKPRGKERPRSGWVKLNSKLIGTELMRPPVDDIDAYIRDFMKGELTREKARNWQKREVDPDRDGFGTG